jgi:hypothetical protein
MFNKLLSVPAIIIAGGALAFLGLPWWMVAVAGIAAGLIFPSPSEQAFAIGFAAGFILWWGASFFFNDANGGLLAGKMGDLFSGLKSVHLLLITGIIGGLLAGLGNLTGSLARNFRQ